MGVHFWLYVSRSTISETDTDRVLNEIVSASQSRNASLKITGTLVYSDRFFGQVIEGPPESLMTLRSSILSDPRHTDIRTIADGKAPNRRFEGWALAYAGTSMVISRALQRALRDTAQGHPDAGKELLEMMEEVLKPQMCDPGMSDALNSL